ncbi:MAG: SbcC/MukB-like Walker B domain-containing protein [Vicinamibacteria bacterium]
MPEAQRLEDAIVRGNSQIKASANDIAALGVAIERAQRQQKEQQAAAAVAQAALHEAKYSSSLDALIESVRNRAASLGVSRQGALASQQELAKKQERLGTLEARIAALRIDSKAARNAAEKASQKVEHAEVALHRAQGLDAANQLRAQLGPGQPCPVCEQTVVSPPPANLNPETEAATRALESATKLQREAETAARAAEDRLTSEDAGANVARANLADLDRNCSLLRATIAREDADIRAALGDHARGHESPLEAWVESEAASLAAARKAHEQAKQRLDTAERAIEAAKAEEASRRERVTDKQAAQAELEKELGANQQTLAALRAQIAAVTQSFDPAAEATELAKQVRALEDALNKAETSAAAAQREQVKAQSESRLLIGAASKARDEATARAKRRDEALSKAGFLDEAAVGAAVLDSATTARFTERVRKFDHDLHAVEQQVATLQEELGEVRVSDEQLTAADVLAKDLSKEAEKQYGEQKILEEQIDRMKTRIDRSRAMKDQLQIDEQSLRVHGQLAGDLRSDKFQAYVLEEAFTDLVNGASTRLLSLTAERYALMFEDDNILVVDNDNAGERRISDTLSGGETFLTSLSLALELSDQVQRAAGAVNLDSLFIDEGFGTLDPDTLALVSETIQSLQAGGRMVGIITHIPELRDGTCQHA